MGDDHMIITHLLSAGRLNASLTDLGSLRLLLIRPPPMKYVTSCIYWTRPAHEAASNFCLPRKSITIIRQMNHSMESVLQVLAMQLLSWHRHCWCWQIGNFREIGIASVDIAGIFRKSALLAWIFAHVKVHQNQWFLHRSAGFRKLALSVCNVDSLIHLIL